MSLTSVRELDAIIAASLSFRDALALAQVASYWVSLCDAGFWQRMISRDFDVDYFIGEPREQYAFLSTVTWHRAWTLGRIDAIQHHQQGEKFSSYDALCAIEGGHDDLFWWFMEQGVEPDENCLLAVMAKGQHANFDWLWARGLRPSECTNLQPGGLLMIIKMMDLGYTPEEEWADWALVCKDHESLDFLYQRGVVPGQDEFAFCCRFNAVPEFEWVVHHGLPLSARWANAALVYGQVDNLKWLHDHDILPTDTTRSSHFWGDLSALSWLEEHHIVQFRASHSDYALQQGWLHVVEWLLDRDIEPTSWGLEYACPEARVWVERYMALKKAA